MLWTLFAFATAFFNGFVSLYSKKLTISFDKYSISFLTSTTIVLCTLPIAIYEGIPTLDSAFLSSLIITGIINTITLVLILKALEITDVSLTAPIFAFSPVFLLITSPFLLGEFPSLIALIGISFILLGAYVLNFKNKITFKPFLSIITNKGQRLILLVTILWAFSSNFYKIGIINSSPIFFILSLNILRSLLLFPFLFKENRFTEIKKHWKVIIPLGLFSAGASISQWIGASMTLVVYIVSIKRLSILISVIGGNFFFKEKGKWQRVLATIIILIGVYIIIFFEK